MERRKKDFRPNQSLPHVRRVKNIKRQSDVNERILKKDDIVLENVLGMTVHNSSCLDTSITGRQD